MKKIYFTTFNKLDDGRITDGWSLHNLIEYGGFKYLAERVRGFSDADIIVYIRNYHEKFEFDDQLAESIIKHGKKIIVFDYMEYGSPAIYRDTYLYDIDILGFQVTGDLRDQILSDYKEEGNKLIDYFLKFSDLGLIYCYFKRELSIFMDTSKSSFPIYPVDFLNCAYTIPNYVKEDEFHKNKSIDLFFSWGFSNIDRPKLHGKILQEIDKFGNIVMSQKHLERSFEDSQRNLLFLYRAEWYDRVDLKKYIPHCKTMIDMYGAGMKCFRNLESALDSVSFKQDPSLLVHAYPWENGKNCVFLPNKNNNQLDVDLACDIIYDHIRKNQHKLFQIYVESKKTADLYLNENYSKNYIYLKIKNLLESN